MGLEGYGRDLTIHPYGCIIYILTKEGKMKRGKDERVVKTLVILYEDDDKILDMTVRELSRGACDLCGDETVRMYIVRLSDGNIYLLCEKCFRKTYE
jgi:hypothetical protein